jgi:hypothetical protein
MVLSIVQEYGALVEESWPLWYVLVWQKDMDLGFQGERGVFCCCLGIIIQLLSYCIVIHFSTLMGRFNADDNYVIKKVQKIRDYCYVLCFFFLCGGEWCKRWSQTRAQDYKRRWDFQTKHVLPFYFLKLSNAMMFCCLTLVDFKMNVHKMWMTFCCLQIFRYAGVSNR